MRWNLENLFCRVPTLHIRLNRDQLGPTPATPVPIRGETARGVQIIRYKPVRQAHGRVVPVSKLLAWSKSSIRNMLHNRSYRAANNNVAEFVFIFRASSSPDVWRWSKGTRSCRSVRQAVSCKCLWCMHVGHGFEEVLSRRSALHWQNSRDQIFVYSLLLYRLHNGRSRRVPWLGPVDCLFGFGRSVWDCKLWCTKRQTLFTSTRHNRWRCGFWVSIRFARLTHVLRNDIENFIQSIIVQKRRQQNKK